MSFIDELWEIGINYIPEEYMDNLRIKGIWDTDMNFQPHPVEVIFELSYVIAQTHHQGCSFYDPRDVDRSEFAKLIGQHFTVAKNSSIPTKIAVLDSIFAFKGKDISPQRKLERTGNPSDKALWRARSVCGEADFQLSQIQTIKSPSVLLLGYSGLILEGLISLGYNVIPFDLQTNLVGLQVKDGISILDGSSVQSYVEKADLIIVTGMTLATESLDGLLASCRKNNTKMIVYAQTAPNIAPWYLQYGANSIVCEYIPFYNFEGLSEISIFRAENWTT